MKAVPPSASSSSEEFGEVRYDDKVHVRRYKSKQEPTFRFKSAKAKTHRDTPRHDSLVGATAVDEGRNPGSTIIRRGRIGRSGRSGEDADDEESRQQPPRVVSRRRHTDMDYQGREDLEQGYRRRTEPPTTARTFPAGLDRNKIKVSPATGKRQYPKEKWVRPPPPPALHELPRANSEAGFNSLDSTDEYLKDYSRFGKYQIDKRSLMQPRFRDNYREDDDERYGSFGSPLRSHSSDDDIAMWRSADECDDMDDEDGPDWDMSLMKDIAHSVAIVASDTAGEDETLGSLELVHFNPDKVQVLSHEHRVPGKPISFPDTTKDQGTLESKSKRASIMRVRKQNRRRRMKSKTYLPDGFITQKSKKDVRGARTMSSLSGSTSFDGSKGFAKILIGRGKYRHNIASLLDEDDDDDDEDYDGDYDDCISAASTGSSGSLPLETQEKFRKQRRAEHRRKIWKSRAADTLSLLSFRGDSSSRASSHQNTAPLHHNKPARRALPTASSSIHGRESKASSITRSISKLFSRSKKKEDDDRLPWEERGKEGILQRAANTILQSHQRRTVEDLPLPKSDSFDSTFAGRDKYQGFMEENNLVQVLRPDETFAIRVESNQVDQASSVTVSSLGSSLPKTAPKRSTTSFGGSIKSLLSKKRF